MKSTLAAVAVLAAGLVGRCAADTVSLSSGETLRGKVLSLDDKQLKMHSDSLGELSLERGKVQSILFGDGAPAPLSVPAPAAATPATPPATAPPTGQPSKSPEEILKMLGAGPSGGTPQASIEQLKKEGISKGTISDLQKEFPLLLTPEVQGYFNGTLQGLASGKIDIQNVRDDAIKARNAIDQLQKELGPEASVLNPYRSILDKFIRETTPPAQPKAPAPTPGQTPQKK